MKQQAIELHVKIPQELSDKLNKSAASQRKTKSELARLYIENGLKNDGLLESKDEIRHIVREEMESCVAPKIERIAALTSKVGWATGAEYFLMVTLLKNIVEDEDLPIIMAKIEQSRKLGIAYLKNKDVNIDVFLKKAIEKI